MGSAVIVLLVLLAIVVVAVMVVVGMYNGLVTLRNRYKNAFSQIDVQLKRRYDLIPNLVEVAKGYIKHERETLEAVVTARNAAYSAGQQAAKNPGDPTAMTALGGAEGQLTGALGRLFAVAEAYPELKADANFRDLQDKLAGIEDEIQMSRRYYNGAVRNLNTMIESFPTNLIAGQFKFEKAEFFEIGDAAAREVPKVDFKTR
jgi:LemA protein